METIDATPMFGDRYYRGVQVTRAPLLRALTQVRWAPFSRNDERVQSVLEALKSALDGDYPRYSADQEVQLQIGPNGFEQGPSAITLHRFSSAPSGWVVVLGPDFVALETTKYERWSSHGERFAKVLAAVESTGQIPAISRVGHRYTNRYEEGAGTNFQIHKVHASLRGHRGMELGDGVVGMQSVGETSFRIDGRGLTARWAALPPGLSPDPTLEPAGVPTWMLDLDSYSDTEMPFETEHLVAEAKQLSRNAFQFFRSVVDEDLLGGPLPEEPS